MATPFLHIGTHAAAIGDPNYIHRLFHSLVAAFLGFPLRSVFFSLELVALSVSLICQARVFSPSLSLSSFRQRASRVDPQQSRIDSIQIHRHSRGLPGLNNRGTVSPRIGLTVAVSIYCYRLLETSTKRKGFTILRVMMSGDELYFRNFNISRVTNIFINDRRGRFICLFHERNEKIICRSVAPAALFVASLQLRALYLSCLSSTLLSFLSLIHFLLSLLFIRSHAVSDGALSATIEKRRYSNPVTYLGT